MKSALTILLFLNQFVSIAQSEQETIKKFMDTLNMGGAYLIGKTMPQFEIRSNHGQLYTNENLKSKVTFINFWFEACAPCIAEMNALETLYEDFRKNNNFQFISITYENKKAIEKSSEKYKMTYPIVTTSFDTCNLLNFRKGYPTTIIINEKSEIVFFTFGGTTDPNIANSNFKNYVYPLLNCMLKCK